MRKYLVLFAPVLASLFVVPTIVFGQVDPAPYLVTIPPTPTAGLPFVADAYFDGGAGSSFTFLDEQPGLIYTYGFPTSSSFGAARLYLPGLPAGSYLLVLASIGFSPEITYASFPLDVAPAAAVVSPVPADNAFALFFLLSVLIASGARLFRVTVYFPSRGLDP